MEEMRERPRVYGPNAPASVFFLAGIADSNGVWRAHAHLDRQIITECAMMRAYSTVGQQASLEVNVEILTPELDAGPFANRTTC